VFCLCAENQYLWTNVDGFSVAGVFDDLGCDVAERSGERER